MLKLYSNIKRLRKMYNMSQQELAEAVGYKGKSMIAQVENGKVDLPASMISKFAEIFNVSELALMGLDDNETDPPAIDYLIQTLNGNPGAKEFLELYQQADPNLRQAVVNTLKAALHKP